MADDSDSKSDAKKSGDDGWSGFLTELLKGFLILRDVFGYAFPGAIFLGVGILSNRIDPQKLRDAYRSYPLPAWSIAALVIVACYAVGHILAAIAYLRWDWPSAEEPPTSVTAAMLDARLRYPVLLVESDRREILAMFRGSTGTGLVLGVVLFYWLKWVPYEWMFVLGGVALLIPFHFSTMRHLNVVKQATVDAAKLSDAKAKENAAAAAAPEASKGLVDALKAWLAPLFK